MLARKLKESGRTVKSFPVVKRQEVEEVGSTEPTPEQAKKHDYAEVDTLVPDDSGTERRGHARRNLTATLLDRYHHRDWISRRQYEAGDKFRADHFLSGLERNIISGYERDRVDEGDPAWQIPGTMRQAAARGRWRAAVQAVGLRLSSVLVDHAILDQSASTVGAKQGGVGKRAEIVGMTTIRLALDCLADHYRIGA